MQLVRVIKTQQRFLCEYNTIGTLDQVLNEKGVRFKFGDTGRFLISSITKEGVTLFGRYAYDWLKIIILHEGKHLLYKIIISIHIFNLWAE